MRVNGFVIKSKSNVGESFRGVIKELNQKLCRSVKWNLSGYIEVHHKGGKWTEIKSQIDGFHNRLFGRTLLVFDRTVSVKIPSERSKVSREHGRDVFIQIDNSREDLRRR